MTAKAPSSKDVLDFPDRLPPGSQDIDARWNLIDKFVAQTDELTRQGTDQIDNAAHIIPDKIAQFRQELNRLDARTINIRQLQAKGKLMGNFKALWSAQQGFNDAKAVVDKISREVSVRRARILDPEKERMQRLKHNLGGPKLHRALLDSDSGSEAPRPSAPELPALIRPSRGKEADELTIDSKYTSFILTLVMISNKVRTSAMTIRGGAPSIMEPPPRFFVVNRTSILSNSSGPVIKKSSPLRREYTEPMPTNHEGPSSHHHHAPQRRRTEPNRTFLVPKETNISEKLQPVAEKPYDPKAIIQPLRPKMRTVNAGSKDQKTIEAVEKTRDEPSKKEKAHVMSKSESDLTKAPESSSKREYLPQKREEDKTAPKKHQDHVSRSKSRDVHAPAVHHSHSFSASTSTSHRPTGVHRNQTVPAPSVARHPSSKSGSNSASAVKEPSRRPEKEKKQEVEAKPDAKADIPKSSSTKSPSERKSSQTDKKSPVQESPKEAKTNRAEVEKDSHAHSAKKSSVPEPPKDVKAKRAETDEDAHAHADKRSPIQEHPKDAKAKRAEADRDTHAHLRRTNSERTHSERAKAADAKPYESKSASSSQTHLSNGKDSTDGRSSKSHSHSHSHSHSRSRERTRHEPPLRSAVPPKSALRQRSSGSPTPSMKRATLVSPSPQSSNVTPPSTEVSSPQINQADEDDLDHVGYLDREYELFIDGGDGVMMPNPLLDPDTIQRFSRDISAHLFPPETNSRSQSVQKDHIGEWYNDDGMLMVTESLDLRNGHKLLVTTRYGPDDQIADRRAGEPRGEWEHPVPHEYERRKRPTDRPSRRALPEARYRPVPENIDMDVMDLSFDALAGISPAELQISPYQLAGVICPAPSTIVMDHEGPPFTKFMTNYPWLNPF